MNRNVPFIASSCLHQWAEELDSGPVSQIATETGSGKSGLSSKDQ